jgi:hypothetical protein
MEETVKTETKHLTDPPIVRESETEHKHRSRTSSKGSPRLTDIEKRVSKSIRRVTRALDNGVDTYITHRDVSKAKRRDGVIVDFVENVARGVSRAFADASPVIHDVAEAANTRRLRSQVRRVVRTFGAIPFVG